MSIESHFAELIKSAVSEALASWTPPEKEPPVRRDAPRLRTFEDAGEYLGISAASVRRLVDTGQLRAVRAFSSVRLDVRDLDAWIESAKGAK